ncbi:hypothetical protein [Flavobacterium denitrificans]|uniref:hypothetical protein n=1 Tax=Flavobacterium denitrificans TaxID=281361 RepID=UPI0004060C1D|nr:hypothetical protein [Flavobacterium denitrificans]
MHIIELPEAKIKRYIPADLSECDSQQYIDMCELIFYYQCNQITMEEFKVQSVYKLMNMKSVKSSTKKTMILDEGISEEDVKFGNIYLIADLIEDFFETGENDNKVIKQYYLHNPVPKYQPAFRKYYGPTDSFMNITFGEYLDALRLFHDFHASGDVKILWLIAAIFYRPKKWFHYFRSKLSNYDGDVRQTYNPNTIDKRAKDLEIAPIGFVYGVYLFFASFQKALVEMKLNWGGQELDLSILFNYEKSDNDNNGMPGIGMDSIAFTMAESGAFGSYDSICKINFWQIIVRMYDIRRSDLERQKQERNATNK